VHQPYTCTNSFHLVVDKRDEGIGIVDTKHQICRRPVAVGLSSPKISKVCETTLISRYAVSLVAILLDRKLNQHVHCEESCTVRLTLCPSVPFLKLATLAA